MASGPPSQRLAFREHAPKVLRSYVGLYRRRAVKGDGQAFASAEPNALAALAVQRAATARPRNIDGDQAVRLIEDLARQVFADGHAAASDIVGHAWADAYGALPLDAPPLEALEAIVVSGAQPGAVGGLYGAVWRALFLASAIPILPAQTRPLAVEQLYRWTDYVRPRVSAMAGKPPAESAHDL